MVTTLQEKIYHWVFTLVGGDSGLDNFILELHQQPQPKSYLTTDMQNICERDTTTAFHDAFVVILMQMFSGYYTCKIIECSLKLQMVSR